MNHFEREAVNELKRMEAIIDELRIALEESVKLQTHYAELLNMHDGGGRIIFKDAAAWIERLKKIEVIRR